MTQNQPVALTPLEWTEIAAFQDVREGWGLTGDMSAHEMAALIYGVKFAFHSGGPGYVGDLYILQGDAAGVPPMVLGRDDMGQLKRM
jgi:hypothetical protein